MSKIFASLEGGTPGVSYKPDNGYATGFADLGSGELGGSAEVVSINGFDYSAVGVALWDTVSVNGPTTTSPLAFSAELNGSTTSMSPYDQGVVELSLWDVSNPAQMVLITMDRRGCGQNNEYQKLCPVTASVNPDVATGTPIRVVMLFNAGINAGSLGKADYTTTATLRLELPTGYSFTSASGVLLSEDTTVPEPATALAAGFGIAALMLLLAVRGRGRAKSFV